MAKEVIINSFLCFMHSAKNDFSRETLLDTADAFYSHENIKSGKVELANLLHKDLIWRRDPEKKRKDLNDVMDFLEELLSSKLRVTFVCDSYKGLPPVGLEFIAPTIVKLTEDLAKMNELLPKILDIKSEVNNTADAVRQVRTDVLDMKNKFNNAVTGMKEATKDIVNDELEVLNDLRSFRSSLGNIESTMMRVDTGISDKTSSPLFSEVVRCSPERDAGDRGDVPSPLRRRGNKTTGPRFSSLGAGGTGHSSDGWSASQNTMNGQSSVGDAESPKNTGLLGLGEAAVGESAPDDGFTVVGRKGKRHERKNSQQGSYAKKNYRMTGVRKDKNTLSFKGVRKTADVFLGRVEKSVTSSNIENYIEETFNIKVKKIDPMVIKSDMFNAFKITVLLDEREKLFDSESWPEGIVINKFYSRRI